MRVKFLHAADIHLGYQQYGLEQRYDDFTEAFRWVVDTALEERVDFLVLAGDLFEKRALDPRTLLIAVNEFEKLKAAGIPVVAIEGNHERTYGDTFSWLEYLNQSKLLYLLDCARGAGGWLPRPWDDEERAGGFVDLAGARIYGLKYCGAQTGAVLNEIGGALSRRDGEQERAPSGAAAAPRADPHPGPLPKGEEAEAKPQTIMDPTAIEPQAAMEAQTLMEPQAEMEPEFSIFLCHTSVEGYFDQGHPFVELNELSKLRKHVDYLALGHVHAPYRGALGDGDWLFNPGCPETWSSEEGQHRDKGANLVNVDTARTPAFTAAALDYPHRRPFIRIRQEMDACPSPERLLDLLADKVDREPLPGAAAAPPRVIGGPDAEPDAANRFAKAPIVEVLLTGIARFSRTEIDADAIEQLARQRFAPLAVRIRSSLQEAPADLIDGGESLSRPVLERMVFENLIRADDRFAPEAAEFAQVATFLKQMALDGAAASEIAEETRNRLRAQRQAARDDAVPADPALADDSMPPD